MKKESTWSQWMARVSAHARSAADLVMEGFAIAEEEHDEDEALREAVRIVVVDTHAIVNAAYFRQLWKRYNNEKETGKRTKAKKASGISADAKLMAKLSINVVKAWASANGYKLVKS
jgi:hypothetical protein